MIKLVYRHNVGLHCLKATALFISRLKSRMIPAKMIPVGLQMLMLLLGSFQQFWPYFWDNGHRTMFRG